MAQVRIEAFVSVPPCSGGVVVKRLLAEIEAGQGAAVEEFSRQVYPNSKVEVRQDHAGMDRLLVIDL